jgi:transcriptional regulator with PAS, ATPase and Fis domain
MCRKSIIAVDDLPPALQTYSDDEGWVRVPLNCSLEEDEKIIIKAAIGFHKNKTKAAEVLGIGRKTLHRKILEQEKDEV